VDNKPMAKVANVKVMLAGSALALPIVIVYAVLFREMRNVPKLDDYHAVLEFVLTLKQLPGLGSRLLWIIAAQHSEYKLIFEHAIIAAQWALSGTVNFEFLIVVGNLMLLGILWVLWHNCFAEEVDLGRRILLFLPVAWLLFQLNYAETLNWAMSGLQIVPTVFFALASLHLLLRSSRLAFVWACLCGMLACFSSGNGFVVAPVGLLLLLPERRWHRIIAWTVTFCVAFWAYLYRYTVIQLPDHGTGVSVLQKVLFWVLFAGGAAENQHRFPVRNGALVLGVLLLAIFAAAWSKGYRKSHPFVFAGVLWVLLTAALVAEGRSGGGIATALTGRYKIYSDLLLIFAYICVAESVRSSRITVATKRNIYAVTLAAVVLFVIASDWLGYKLLLKRNSRVAQGLSEYAADPVNNVPMISISGDKDVGGAPLRARVILNESLASGIYALPPADKR